MNFLSGQILMYSGDNYENVYKLLNESYDIKYHDLFVFAVQLGFKHNKREERVGKGREFRSNYLSLQQKGVLYSVILNDPKFSRNLDDLTDQDFLSRCKNTLEEYAVGGLRYLCTEAFGFKWNGVKLDESYSDYDLDLMTFIKQEFEEIPF